jgi:hypothetical protein
MDDYTIAATAAEAELGALIKQFVPPMFQSRIPAEVLHKGAVEIGKAVVDALTAAHAAAPQKPST